MSMNPESKTPMKVFSDWVNANSPEIPEEVVYPPKADDHGHGHDDHGDHGHDAHCDAHDGHAADAHGHDEHGHDDHGHDEHGHDDHGHDDHGHAAHAPAKKEKKPRSERAIALSLDLGYRMVAGVCGFILALILLATVAALPRFGSPDAPAVNEVSRRYLEEGLTDTGAVNAVTGMILDYRAFDTLGESLVLFTATVTVIFLLQQSKRRKDESLVGEEEANETGVRSIPAKVVIRISFPFVLLYGIYIVVNGHLSPGGGFSGGTILGGALILAHLAFGETFTKRFATVAGCSKVMAVALFGYIGLKTYSILTGANEMASAIPLGTPGSIFSSGLIFPLNICVGLVVACTMFTLYSLFTEWKS